MTEWCNDLPTEHLQQFQKSLLKQPASWYVTKPSRINFLLSAEGPRETKLMLAAALAMNGETHPLLEAKFPGIDSCIVVVNAMMGDTKEKNAYLRSWLNKNASSNNEVFSLELPDFT